jgi:hypothetical protein
VKPDPRFSNQDRPFWAHVRFASERIGYSVRAKKGGAKSLRRYSITDLQQCLQDAGLRPSPVAGAAGSPTPFGQLVLDYLNFRADLIERQVAPCLMTRDQARSEFERLRKLLKPKCALPMNKQRGEKRHHAYMVGIINMLTERALAGRAFTDEPRGLTVVTDSGSLARTFSRWMDGAYPSLADPYAVWEVKEYYGTTTFGSRVADGVYESMLDGYELGEFHEHTGRRVLHYLIVDDRFTWWDCGRSYLCRLVDMMHMGLVDEVLFGREVLKRWPEIVRAWP